MITAPTSLVVRTLPGRSKHYVLDIIQNTLKKQAQVRAALATWENPVPPAAGDSNCDGPTCTVQQVRKGKRKSQKLAKEVEWQISQEGIQHIHFI